MLADPLGAQTRRSTQRIVRLNEVRFLVAGAQFEAMGELLQATGQQVDAEAMQGFAALGAIAGLFQSVPVFGSAAGASSFKFVAQTNPENFRVALDEIDGAARLYCTLDRKFAQNEQYSIVDSIRVSQLPLPPRWLLR
jgi:hypothetical protein